MKICLSVLAFAILLQSAPAFDGRVFAPGQKPDDQRLGDPVTLHDYHPFRPVASKEEWSTRRLDIQRRVQLAAGLLPWPDKTPLQEIISERFEKDGFAIENVYFESFPGHFVTGTLFSPSGESLKTGEKKGLRPVVLCPHGHWRNGRFHNAGDSRAKAQLASGGERFYNAGLNPIIPRCVQLARMGCFVFAYDMLGNADSVQLVEHRRGPRDETNSSEFGKWGFVSPQSALRLQTNFGLQTWNSVRALDFMLSRPGADPDRVLVTGASGGATQTMMLAAIDERVDASFPCVMASTAMQGGCTCENSYYLRIGQGNMDIAAVPAPKPLGLTAADDWTIELETKGHPDLLDLYTMLGAKKSYDRHFDIQFRHNYNHVSRTHMYQFVNTHFSPGLKTPVLERDYSFLTPEELTVWKTGERPPNYLTGLEHEREVNRVWAEDGDRKIEQARKTNRVDDFRKGWGIIIRRTLADVGSVDFELIGKEKHSDFTTLWGVIRNQDEEEEIPALFYYPDNWNGTVTLIPSGHGKSGLFLGVTGSPADQVIDLLQKGNAVVGMDLFAQGEFLDEGEIPRNTAATYSSKPDLEPDSWQRSPVYFYGYNDSIFVRRVHDILTTVKMIQTSPNWDVKSIEIQAAGPFAAIAYAAAISANGAFSKIDAHPDTFSFGALNDSFSEHFVPGAVRFGDVEMLEKLASGAD
ncbi:MAG: hypothetical protein P1V20_15690 [Verrucomicrobiales bacterium]|nr:hypothetical protein [Verrucomicrobiales bacterium]